MQDRQTQVRAGPARVVGRLRETDGMVTGRSDAAAAATHRRASLTVIRPGEKVPDTAEPSRMDERTPHALVFTSGILLSSSFSLSDLLSPPPSVL